MTIAYEFSTQLAENGTVTVPARYRDELPAGASVRVILLTEESNVKNGQNGQNGQNSHSEEANPDIDSDDMSALEELVARIQRMGLDPNNFTPASGDLAKHLQEISAMSDPDFNLEEWTRQWDEIEAEMKRNSLEHEAQEWKEFA